MENLAVESGGFLSNIIHLGLWISSRTWAMLLCILLPLLVVYYVQDKRQRDLYKSLPSLKNYPIIGDLTEVVADQSKWYELLMQMCEENRNAQAVHISLLSKHWVLVFGADTVGDLLRSTVHITKAVDYDFLHPWLGTGLLTSTGQKWHTRRKMLTPSFHFNILKDFLISMNEQADLLKEKLTTLADTGKAVDLFPIITLNSLDIICATAMGFHMNALQDSESEYVKAVYQVGEAIAHRTRKPWLQNDLFYNHIYPTGKVSKKNIRYMHQFTRKVIEERREILEASSAQQQGRKRAFLDMLLACTDENGKHLSFEDIREEVDTFMFEGHDTTTSGIVFTLYILGAHPAELLKCQQEQDEIFESPRETTMDDLRRMTYLEAAIKEAMRLFPPVPWYSRCATEDFKIADYTIPKGTDLIVIAQSLHTDPKVFPDPLKYDPTRFLAENSQNRHPYGYVPFSAGVRNCIGQKFAMMELKVIVSMIISNFNIKSTQQRDELRLSPTLVMKTENGVWAELSNR